MSRGYYKRRRGLIEHLESGKISLLDLAVHDYLNLKANLVIGSDSSIPAGVCITSAAAIHATCPAQISERAIQRSLEHLEAIGWIKRWNTRGKRGNYPTLVCRSSVADLSGKEHRVSGTKTTDWRFPVYEPVGDLSSLREVADAKLSGDREVRSIEARKSAAPKPACFSSEETVWGFLGISPCGPPSFRSLLETGWASRNGQARSVFIGNCVDAWEGTEGKRLPAPQLFRALDQLRKAERDREPATSKLEIVRLEVPA